MESKKVLILLKGANTPEDISDGIMYIVESLTAQLAARPGIPRERVEALIAKMWSASQPKSEVDFDLGWEACLEDFTNRLKTLLDVDLDTLRDTPALPPAEDGPCGECALLKVALRDAIEWLEAHHEYFKLNDDVTAEQGYNYKVRMSLLKQIAVPPALCAECQRLREALDHVKATLLKGCDIKGCRQTHCEGNYSTVIVNAIGKCDDVLLANFPAKEAPDAQ